VFDFSSKLAEELLENQERVSLRQRSPIYRRWRWILRYKNFNLRGLEENRTCILRVNYFAVAYLPLPAFSNCNKRSEFFRVNGKVGGDKNLANNTACYVIK